MQKQSLLGAAYDHGNNYDLVSAADYKLIQEQLEAISDTSSDLSEELFRDVDVLSDESEKEKEDFNFDIYNPLRVESFYAGHVESK